MANADRGLSVLINASRTRRPATLTDARGAYRAGADMVATVEHASDRLDRLRAPLGDAGLNALVRASQSHPKARAVVGEIVFPSTTLWGRGDVASLYDRISAAANALRLDIAPFRIPWSEGGAQSTPDTQRFIEDWSRFYREWATAHTAYDRDPIVVPVATGSSVVETARGFAERFNALETRFRTLSGTTPTTATSEVTVLAPPQGPPGAPERMLNTASGIATAIAVIAVAGVAALVFTEGAAAKRGI